ncbi:hypothetical protein ONV75_18640 [Clostridium sp. LQ25]|uniref:hypothetical protein n=1 Tax=Clostridium TaxID=1485 RepID=UPI00051BC426|nr:MULTISPECIES: hypothetical protein [Clostridium]APF21662.1 hypothetical protein NPD4_4031 [Clostridium butyricum]QUF85223.1 hypothetical protein KDJ93_19375 [Clostridium butyricum]UZT08621.1 hypothetical protein ONV75_18640 [Clostridium sp. LQ25]
MKAICPNNCAKNEFHTVAHISQYWKVDNHGEFIEVLDNCLEIIHKPNTSDIWICSQCGAEAIVKY